MQKTNTPRCARGDTICLRPCKLTISSYLFAMWQLFQHLGYLRHQQQVDLWPFDLESGVRVMCDVGYQFANFSLPRPLCSRLRPDVRDRQTSDAHHRLMPPLWDGSIIICTAAERGCPLGTAFGGCAERHHHRIQNPLPEVEREVGGNGDDRRKSTSLRRHR